MYKYKDDLGVPPLGMVDDVLAISQCGVDSVLMNAFLNQKTSMKRLQFGPDKCHQLHIGKSQLQCPDLYIDQWKLMKRDELVTGVENLEDVQVEDHKFDTASEEKYLGDVISVDGKNSKNIESRRAKAQGIIKQVKNILEEMCFGYYVFEVAIILRNSLFVNGILTNMEASYGLVENDIEILEKCDEQLLRAILECPCSTPREMLYLELGVVPLRFIIMSRRSMFYQYILKQDKNSLFYKFYQKQCVQAAKNDWCLTVKQNMEKLKINISEVQVQNMSKSSFKKIVSEAVKKEAFEYLIKLKNSHSKVAHIKYGKFEMQDYLVSSQVSPDQAKFTFMCRSRMLLVRANFKGSSKTLSCPICEKVTEYDSQAHLLVCTILNHNVLTYVDLPNYDDLFGKNLEKKIAVVRLLKENFQKRSKILKPS